MPLDRIFYDNEVLPARRKSRLSSLSWQVCVIVGTLIGTILLLFHQSVNIYKGRDFHERCTASLHNTL